MSRLRLDPLSPSGISFVDDTQKAYKQQNGYVSRTNSLRELNDISIVGTPTNGQALVYDSATGKFTPKDVASNVNDALSYKGAIDASTNPNYPAADAGDVYKISVAGRIGGASGALVTANDMLICTQDGSPAGTQATVGNNWDIIQGNLDDATTTTKGIVQLAGDLGGTAAAPTVPGLATKEPAFTVLPIAKGGTNASTAATAFANIKQNANSTTTGVIQLAGDITGTATSVITKSRVSLTCGFTANTYDYQLTGTNDQNNINAAITAANAAGGGTVTVMPGAGNLSNPIVLLSNVRLIFQLGATFTMNQTNKYVFRIVGQSNIIVENGIFTLSGTAGLLQSLGHANLIFRNVEVTGTSTVDAPIILDGGNGGATGTYRDTVIENMYAHDLPGIQRLIRLYPRNGHTIDGTYLLDSRITNVKGQVIDLDAFDTLKNTYAVKNIIVDPYDGDTFGGVVFHTRATEPDYFIDGMWFGENSYTNTRTDLNYEQGLVYAYTSKNLYIWGNRSIGTWSPTQDTAGPWFAPGRTTFPLIGAKVWDNYIEGFDSSMDADAMYEAEIHNNTVVNCGHGFAPGYGLKRNINIHHNTERNSSIRNPNNALFGSGAGTPENCIVADNTYIDDLSTAMATAGAYFSGSGNDFSRLTFRNNTFRIVNGTASLGDVTFQFDRPRPLIFDNNWVEDTNGKRLMNLAYSLGNVPTSATISETKGDTISLTLTGNATLTFAAGSKGKRIRVQIAQDATGNRVPTFSSNVKFNNSAIKLSTTASAVDYITFMYDGTNWQELTRLISDTATAYMPPDATTTSKGVVQLAGDLSGTAAVPTVKSRLIKTTVAPAGTTADSNTDGVADEVEINAALTNGATLLRAGSYSISSPIIIPSNGYLTAERGAIITLANGANSSMIVNADTTNGNTNIFVDTLQLNANKANQTGTSSAIALTKVTDSKFYNVKVDSAVGSGYSLTNCTNVRLDNVVTSNNAQGGIIFAGTKNSQIYGSVTKNNGTVGIALGGESDFTDVSHTYIGYNGAYGLLGGTAADTNFNKRNRYISNVVEYNQDDGLVLDRNPDCLCVGNHVRYNGSIGTDEGLPVDTSPRSIIVGNRVEFNAGAGIQLKNSSNYCSVQGNTVSDNSNPIVGGPATGAGILVETGIMYCTISGNTVFTTEATPSQRRGIYLTGTGIDYNTVSNNTVYGNSVNQIELSSNVGTHNNVFNNPGSNVNSTNTVFDRIVDEPLRLNNSIPATSALDVTPTGNTSASISGAAGIHLDNTNNTGYGMSLYTNMGAGASAAPFGIQNNNTAWNFGVALMQLTNVTPKSGVVINQNTAPDASQAPLVVFSNNNNSTANAYGLLAIQQLNASSTNRALLIQHNGTGEAISISAVQGKGIIINENGNAIAADINRSPTNKSLSTIGFSVFERPVVNDGTTYTKSGTTFEVNAGVTQTSGSITDTSKVARFVQTNAANTGTVVEISNSGTGKALDVIGTGAFSAVRTGTIQDTNGNTTLTATPATSAVNYYDITNAATGVSPIIQAAGADANIGAIIKSKGNGRVILQPGATNRADGIQMVNAAGTQIVNVDTSNSRMAVGAGVTSSNSTLQVVGSFATAIRTFTASSGTPSTNATVSDGTIAVDTSANSGTVVLPTAVGIAGRMYRIKKLGPDTNTLNITTTSSQTIDGATSFSTTATVRPAYTVQSDGSNWIFV